MEKIFSPNSEPMDQREIDLTREVSAYNDVAAMYLYQMRDLAFRSDFPYIDALRYLKRHKITGERLVDQIINKYDRSMLEFSAHLRKKINGESKTRPFFAKPLHLIKPKEGK